MNMSIIDYKFNENKLIQELWDYVDSTYDQHYAGGKIQATEDIIDDGHGTGFCVGNAKKYLKRYGKKGETPVEWRRDLMKVLHYTLIQLYVHDQEHQIKFVLDDDTIKICDLDDVDDYSIDYGYGDVDLNIGQLNLYDSILDTIDVASTGEISVGDITWSISDDEDVTITVEDKSDEQDN